jgi:tetratricopeptide (TPR) repeat protein
MSDDPRVQQLLDELIDSHSTPEAVCRSCPEVLPTVKNRWRQMRRVQADLDALFPPSGDAVPQVSAEGVQSLLGDTAPKDLLERVRQTRADADMVAELEEIRPRMSAGPKGDEAGALTPDKVYADAFRNYGIPLLTLEPGEAAEGIRKSAIRDTLLAFLHDWLFWVSPENRDRLRDVLDLADDDAWRHAYRIALLGGDMKKLSALAHAPEAPDQLPVVLSGLAGTMLADQYKNEALSLLREAQQRHPGDFWINYLLGMFWYKDHPQEAAGYFRVAVAVRPTSDGAWVMLGRALLDSGDADGAIAAFRQSVALNPNSPPGPRHGPAPERTGGGSAGNARRPSWRTTGGRFRFGGATITVGSTTFSVARPRA